MARQMTHSAPQTKRAAAPNIPTVGAQDGLAYFQGQFVPMSEATVSVATHGLNYGTGCFEGIRGYWNEAADQLYILKLREHYERFANSRRMLKMQEDTSVDELCATTLDLLRRQQYRQDV